MLGNRVGVSWLVMEFAVRRKERPVPGCPIFEACRIKKPGREIGPPKIKPTKPEIPAEQSRAVGPHAGFQDSRREAIWWGMTRWRRRRCRAEDGL